VHGYNLQCLASVDPTTFVSGADEKILRVFEAPSTFLETFANITRVTLPTHARPALGASVPALGLSNKAVFLETLASSVIARADTNDRLENTVLPFAPAVLASPPLEEHLLQNTLWPESKKLYGHGYELLCVAANHAGTLIVSACHATKPEHAAIRAWSVATWTELYQLPGHALSVTQMEFSHDDTFLLSGSRDRSFQLYRRMDSSSDRDEPTAAAAAAGASEPARAMPAGLRYVPYCSVAKAHERIIWSVSWALDDALFLTASRDKVIKAWLSPASSASLPIPAAAAASAESAPTSSASSTPVCAALASFTAAESVTAVACGTLVGSAGIGLSAGAGACGPAYVVAAGLETGAVILLALKPITAGASASFTILSVVTPDAAFAGTVVRLCWQPAPQPNDTESSARLPLLAAAGRDSFVRVYALEL
jgi:elongator complex protein 2